MKHHAVWFRQDLRVTDHRALSLAAEEARRDGGGVVCIYCVDPREHAPGVHLGRPRTGPFRLRFLIESLGELRTTLRALGSDLLVQWGSPTEVLPALARDQGWRSLRYHRLVGTEERSLEAEVGEALQRDGVAVHPYWDRTLHGDYPFPVEETPEVFSVFRKRVEREAEISSPLGPPASLPPCPEGLEPGSLPRLEDFDMRERSSVPDERCVLSFVGGSRAGRARLFDFIDGGHLSTYKETRNGLIGADYSSKLSPWLALGCLSCREVQAAVAAFEGEHGANDSTYWMTFELLWRDYFQLIVQKHGPAVFRPSGLQGIPVPWKTDPGAFEAWRTGQTGYPFVDASMRELLATGFMSNRGRQNVGSFLTKNLGLDWRLGAEWFEVQLVDHDVASNYGNWNYTAGVGNDARGFRYFHIPKQAGMYDPTGDHAKLWCPELRGFGPAEVHTPWLTSKERQGKVGCVLGEHYPRPMVDLEESQRSNRKAWEEAVQIGRPQ